jgi:N-acetylmuramoyl-L-alanine amidase
MMDDDLPTVVLVPGHNAKDQGADLPNDNYPPEYDFMSTVARNVRMNCRSARIMIVPRPSFNGYNQQIRHVWNVGMNYDPICFVSLHYNSSSTPAGTGVETIYHENATPRVIAQAFQDGMTSVLPFRDRGIKHSQRGRGKFLVRNAPVPHWIAEPFFITGWSEQVYFRNHNAFKEVEKAVIAGIDNVVPILYASLDV